MPSSISWSSRCSLPPPYSRSVTLPFALVVLLDVGVEQQQRDPADPGQPHARAQAAPAGQVQGDQDRSAEPSVAQQRQRQPVGVQHR